MSELLFILVLAGCEIWLSVVLVHAFRTGVMWNRAGNVSESEHRVQFWICSIIALLGLIFILGMTIVLALGIFGRIK